MDFEFLISDIMMDRPIFPFSSELYQKISINLHSQKGLARSIGEKEISGPLHLLEDLVAEINKKPENFDF